jgi:NAD-dependent dihydropyrimidine dehydrogenase PreA subunit
MYNAYEINTLVYDPQTCNGCALCEAVCPHAVFEMNGRKAVLVRPLACMECGACQRNCITGAIQVESGVGCANAMIRSALLGLNEPECNCS